MNKFKYTVIVFLLIASCASVQKYYNRLESFMLQDDHDSAETLATASKEAYGGKNELLYYLDVGMLNHLSQQYKESNSAFEEAKRIYDINYTKSISAGLFSLFSNDNMVPYYGKPYEMAYTNVFCALNYIMQGMNNESVVEARQTDNLFKKIQADSNGRAFYSDDGFIRYFMGIVYENAGYLNDALISYKMALKAYGNVKLYVVPVPEDLVNNLYTLYFNLGMDQEASELKNKYPYAKKTDSPHTGELIIINYNGLAPKKIENIMEISFYKALPYFNSVQITNEDQAKAQEVRTAVQAGIADDYIKVSFPKYYRYNNRISSFSLEETVAVSSNSITTVEIKGYNAVDIASLLEKNLNNEISLIYARTIARAVGRYVLTKAVSDNVKKQSKNDSLGILTKSLLNIASGYMEKADIRSWRTLPANINMLRVKMSPGIHELTVNYLDNNSNVVNSEKISAAILENKKTFVILRSFVNYKGNVQSTVNNYKTTVSADYVSSTQEKQNTDNTRNARIRRHRR
ncbi:MAG: hypothetical protein WC234_00725 [Endomicrobiaceae bacterium]